MRYSWSKPNPFFLPLLAQATPLFIYMPAHYLKQFHERYADPDKLAEMVEETQARDWAQLHGRKDGMYDFDNPDLPTLQPWMLTNAPPATRFVFARNPYFHRVDPNGQQLPYIDEVLFDVVDDQLIPIKTGAGETDLQSRGLFFKRLYLLEGERGAQRPARRTCGRPRKARIWRSTRTSTPRTRSGASCSAMSRFRRALSLGIDRDEINQIMYYGLGMGGNNTVLPQSPLYQPEYRETWASYDPEQANALLDEIGLTERSVGRLAAAARRPADGAGGRDRGRGVRAVRRPRAGRRGLARLSASRSTPGPRSARCSATGSSRARP